MRKVAVLFFWICSIAVYGQTPSKASSGIKFSNVGCQEFTVDWTNGDGFARVVFVKEGYPFTATPEPDEFYNYNSIYTKAPSETIYQDGIHWCVYRGTGNSVKVTGLKKSRVYSVAIFEYNANGGGKYEYLTASFARDTVRTLFIKADFDTLRPAQCQNANFFKFINKSSTAQTGGLTYAWDFGDGKTSIVKDPTHVHATWGIYKIQLVAIATGCRDTMFQTDTVDPHPVARYTLDTLKPKNDSVQCFFGNRFTFMNQTTLGSHGGSFSSTSYKWYTDNDTPAFQTAYKADKAFTSSGTFRVKLVATSNKGCKDSTFKYYTVLPRGIDPKKVLIDPRSLCLKNNVFEFTNNSPNSISSRWLFGDLPKDTVNGKSVKHTYKDTGKYYIQLIAYDASPRRCLDVHLDSVNVIPNTKVSFIGLNNEYCLNTGVANLKPTPGKGEFFGTNVNPLDSTFTPASLGKFTVGYVYAVGNCRDTAWASTEVFNKPVVDLGKDTVICDGQPLQLHVTNPAYTSVWTGGRSGPDFEIKTSGTYGVTVKERNCTSYDEIVVKSIAAPTITHMPDTTLCGGSYLKFNLKAELGTAIWRDGVNAKDRNINKSGFYQVVLSNKCGSVSDSFKLTVEETACIIFFPNAFTPNGDLLNDIWQPFGKYDFLKMTIYNRWGEKVYFSDLSPVWDGWSNHVLSLDGVYNIVFECLMQDGNSQKKVTKGIVVHLIR